MRRGKESTIISDATWGTGTGLDRVRAVADSLAHTVRSHLGLVFSELEKGRVVLRWTPADAVLNPAGVVHGGYIAAALDEVCGVTAISLSNPSTPYLTMSLNVDYLRPLAAGPTYTVAGTVQQSGGTRTLVRAEISDAAGQLCAQAICALTPNRKVLAAAARARATERAQENGQGPL
ncbi:PaaI family thioesterase [Streptomyces sp. NPDC058466]|uniref:PaaI family thioesterase n=1 Tax=Streptomyces sp. NPDC058466 TaxID=3346512 RepID=UPI0036544EB6